MNANQINSWALCRKLDQLIQTTPNQTADPKFIQILRNLDSLGHIFLIIYDTTMWHKPKFAFNYPNQPTLAELDEYFHRPNADIKYWILKTQYMNLNFLQENSGFDLLFFKIEKAI